MEDTGGRADARPTVGKMMARDLFTYMSFTSPIMVAMVLLFSVSAESTDGSEEFDPVYLYALLVLTIAAEIVIMYWRWSIYSSVLNSGVEVPGEVTSVTRSGDTVTVEYTYRWQAETVKSTGKVGGYIPKRRIKEEVGLKATLLVDPGKPKRFLVLDTLR